MEPNGSEWNRMEHSNGFIQTTFAPLLKLYLKEKC